LKNVRIAISASESPDLVRQPAVGSCPENSAADYRQVFVSTNAFFSIYLLVLSSSAKRATMLRAVCSVGR
jgi:hypothetical protein